MNKVRDLLNLPLYGEYSLCHRQWSCIVVSSFMKFVPSFTACHRVAGITFQTEADVQIPHLLESAFKRFQVKGVRADVWYRIIKIDTCSLPVPVLNSAQQELLLRTVGFPRKWLDKAILCNPDVREKVEVCLENPELTHIGLRWGRAVIRNYARNELDFFYPPDNGSDFADLIMTARYRNMLATFLPNLEALMLHGAGIIRNGAAILFLAPDEGGKSTLIKLSDRDPVLTDDQVILKRQDGFVFAHGTPFAPITEGPLQAVLGGIFLLEKSSRFALSPLSVLDAIQFIWNEHTHQWFLMPKSLRLRAFELIADACKQAPIFRLQFSNDYIDWDAIDQVLQR